MKISCAKAQCSQTLAECAGLFHLPDGYRLEKRFVMNSVTLLKTIHLILRRFDRKEFFHSTIVFECVVCDGSGEQCEHWSAHKSSRL